jgi:TusA-related sulfurtransferase
VISPLDLRGTRCPLNYVRTRLRLEAMAVGEEVEVWLDRGEPEVQVPRSLRLDGQSVTELDGESGGGCCRILVRREV